MKKLLKTAVVVIVSIAAIYLLLLFMEKLLNYDSPRDEKYKNEFITGRQMP